VAPLTLTGSRTGDMSALRHARSPIHAHTNSLILLPGNNVGLARLRVPRWVWEGLPDFVAIENREPFEQLRDALGDQPVDIPMMM
jgi:hypothetical protein